MQGRCAVLRNLAVGGSKQIRRGLAVARQEAVHGRPAAPPPMIATSQVFMTIMLGRGRWPGNDRCHSWETASD